MAPAALRSLGVLLAGGRGSRLGAAVPKALVECGGRTLLARALATLEPVCDEIVVVAPRAMQLPVPASQRVHDPEGEQGPLAALVAGLEARAFAEACVLAVDLPLVTSQALRALRALRADALAVMAAPGGLPQPLAAWYSSGARTPLARASEAGERSVIAACRMLPARLVEGAALVHLPDGEGFQWNVNTPEDLSRAERALAGPRS